MIVFIESQSVDYFLDESIRFLVYEMSENGEKLYDIFLVMAVKPQHLNNVKIVFGAISFL